MMGIKLVLVLFGLLSISIAQDATFDRLRLKNEQLSDIQSEIEALIERVRELLEIVRPERPEVPDWVPDRWVSVIENILDNGLRPSQITCIIEAFEQLDRDDLREASRTLLRESRNHVELLIARRRELAECDAIGGDNPSVVDLARRQLCIREVEATSGPAIAASQIRLRRALRELQDAEDLVRSCFPF